MADKKLRVTLVRSAIGYKKNQKATVKALGLRKLHTSVVLSDTPSIRGMINTVVHLVQVDEVSE